MLKYVIGVQFRCDRVCLEYAPCFRSNIMHCSQTIYIVTIWRAIVVIPVVVGFYRVFADRKKKERNTRLPPVWIILVYIFVPVEEPNRVQIVLENSERRYCKYFAGNARGAAVQFSRVTQRSRDEMSTRKIDQRYFRFR